MQLNSLFDQVLKSDQFIRLASFVLLMDLFIGLSGSAAGQASTLLETVSQVSIRDLILVFFAFLMIRAYWSIWLIAPLVLIVAYVRIERIVTGDPDSYDRIAAMCFNVWAFTPNEEFQDRIYAVVVFYCAVFYYCTAAIFIDDLSIYSFSEIFSKIISIHADGEADSYLIPYSVVFALLVFLFMQAFFGVLKAHSFLRTAETKSETEKLLEASNRKQRNRLEDIAYAREQISWDELRAQQQRTYVEKFSLWQRRKKKK